MRKKEKFYLKLTKKTFKLTENWKKSKYRKNDGKKDFPILVYKFKLHWFFIQILKPKSY